MPFVEADKVLLRIPDSPLRPSTAAAEGAETQDPSSHSVDIPVPRKKGFGVLGASAVMLYVVLMSTCLWFYGTNYGAGDRAYRLKVCCILLITGGSQC
jgi:hypothetical protein